MEPNLVPCWPGFYYQSSGESELNLTLMRLIDKLHTRTPHCGVRQMARFLRSEGYLVGCKRIRRPMQKMGPVQVAAASR
jgi:putative transposase